jgi:translation elongation factor EF-Tu-like GTPase
MIDVIANIHLLRADEGGRQSFIFSGYRPNIRFADDVYVDGAITFSDREKVFPGDKCQVKIRFPKPEFVKEYLTVGTSFDINEGSHKVGEGEILTLP